MVKVTVTLKGLDSNKIKKEIYQNDEAGLFIANTVAKFSDDYVPFLKGPLSQTVITKPFKLIYDRDYAFYQWEGERNGKPFNYTKTYHPKATRHWTEAAVKERNPQIIATLNDYFRSK